MKPQLIFILIFQVLCVHIQHLKTIAIIGTNDIHGEALPVTLTTSNNTQYKYGGLVYMARLIQIIQQQHKHNVLYLNAGDDFSGGFQASTKISKGQIIDDFFNILHLNASAIGNHEFDRGKKFLDNFLQYRNAISLSANLRSEKGEKNFLPNQQSTKVFTISDIKIGVIGLSTIFTKTSSAGFLNDMFPNYSFQQYKEIVMEQSERLREQQQCNAVLILSHVGNYCPQNKTYDIRTNQTKYKPCQKDEIIKLIDELPEGTIDGIVAGHRHQLDHHYYKNIPFMSSIRGDYYFNVLYLNFDSQTKQIVSSAIEGPIPVCQKIFSSSLDCTYHEEKQLQAIGTLTNWTFHDKPVYAHPELSQIFQQKWIPLLQPYQKVVFQTQILLEPTKKQSSLMNLISTMFHKSVEGVDFSFVSQGNLRNSFYPGNVTEYNIHNMLPFQDHLSTFQIYGRELKNLLSFICSKNNYCFSGVTVFLHEQVTFKKNKKITQRELVKVTLSDGSQIEDDKLYVGITFDFFMNGGDEFKEVFERKIYLPRNVKDYGLDVELAIKQLKKIGVVRKGDWYDAQNPRICYV